MFAAATVTFAPLDSATDITIQSPTITLTFNQAVTKASDGVIENVDLASMLSFKLDDATGKDVPCSMSIDSDKKIVTIVPSADLVTRTRLLCWSISKEKVLCKAPMQQQQQVQLGQLTLKLLI